MLDDVRLAGYDSAKPYPLKSSTDLFSMPSPTFLIEDFFPEGAVIGLTSYPGLGKTWFALDASRAVATGGLFLNFYKATEGAVLFVGSDASEFDYARQWRRLAMEEYEKLNPDASSAPDYVNPLKENIQFLIQSDFLFESRDAILRLIKTSNEYIWGPLHEVYDETTGKTDSMRNHGFRMIVFDTVSKLTRADQNSNTEMEEVFRNIRLIAEQTGAVVFLLHHNAKASEFKDGEDWRGAMSQIGALDCWFQLAPSRASSDVIQVKVKKFRGITPQPFFYRTDVNEGDPAEEPSAHLTKVEEPKDVMFDDGIAESAVELLRSPNVSGKWLTLKQIVDGLYPQYADLFANDRSKFETAVRNRLKNETRKGKPTVKMAGGGTRGRKSTFSAVIMDRVLAEDPELRGEDDGNV